MSSQAARFLGPVSHREPDPELHFLVNEAIRNERDRCARLGDDLIDALRRADLGQDVLDPVRHAFRRIVTGD